MPQIKKVRLEELLDGIQRLRIGVIGDFALDFYYEYLAHTGEQSIETGKEVFHGSQLRTSPGAAGNVVQNLAALKPAAIRVFGLVGNDLYGRELRFLLTGLKADTSGLLEQSGNWDTHTYTKPLLELQEQNRLDFGGGNIAAPERVQTLFATLENALPKLDVLIVNQQFQAPLITPERARQLDTLTRRYPAVKVVVDSRDFGDSFPQAVLKINALEVARLLKCEPFDENREADCRARILELHRQRRGAPLLMTRGANGIMVVENEQVSVIPGIFIMGEMDTVGAGDTCVATAASCLGAGGSLVEAAQVANLASSISVRKLNQTGTATPDELRHALAEAEPVYAPDLADDIRLARYLGDSQIEIIRKRDAVPVRQVILDHDGTLSTLREGWEAVMFEVAMDCVCGEQLPRLPMEHYQRIARKVRRMIEQTTGVQTIRQMMYLREMVVDEKLVPDSAILTAADYKKKYLDRLMVSVRRRIQQIQQGEMDTRDYCIKGSLELLQAFHQRGFRLTLASGTDQDDVRQEAAVMGYAELFDGGIYGSLGNELGDAKRKVIQRIVQETEIPGPSLMIMGDGPVEMREGRRVGAFCVGVASDEARRHGLNLEKRERLIRAGADLILPDYAQLSRFLPYLATD